MIVHFVGAGPGDPELLTLKAARLLSACQICVYAGSLVSPSVMALVPDGAERHDSARMSHEEVVAVYRDAQARGIDVVRLHSGDPSIYGAIREQMSSLDGLGIPYDVCPGVSSFQAAAAALKTELTAPEVSQTIILTRTAGRTPLPETQALEKLARAQATLCIFLSVDKLREVAATLAAHYGEDCPAAVVHRASWPEEKVILGTLSDIAAKAEPEGIRLQALILVGRALGRDIPASKLYDAAFSHGCREAKTP
ncbi:MAG: precorrin-4 C(11)-methyltransferase [Syntrophales bacterium]